MRRSGATTLIPSAMRPWMLTVAPATGVPWPVVRRTSYAVGNFVFGVSGTLAIWTRVPSRSTVNAPAASDPGATVRSPTTNGTPTRAYARIRLPLQSTRADVTIGAPSTRPSLMWTVLSAIPARASAWVTTSTVRSREICLRRS